MRSALSALGFRIGGQPQSLDYGGGDKSGLTDIGTWITFLPLASRLQEEKTSPCDVRGIACVSGAGCRGGISDYGLETSTARTVHSALWQ